MAITDIDTVTPTVGLKAAADIINGNMNDVTNAAAALVQTSATDATAGRVLTTDRAGAVDSPIFNDNNYQPFNTDGLGVKLIMRNVSGVTRTKGQSSIPGSSLRHTYFNASGVLVAATASDGLWTCTSEAVDIADDNYGYFTKNS